MSDVYEICTPNGYVRFVPEARYLAEISAAQTRIGELEAALRTYGGHVSPCETQRSPKLLKQYGLERWPCTCGFEALASFGGKDT